MGSRPGGTGEATGNSSSNGDGAAAKHQRRISTDSTHEQTTGLRRDRPSSEGNADQAAADGDGQTAGDGADQTAGDSRQDKANGRAAAMNGAGSGGGDGEPDGDHQRRAGR